MMRARCAVLLAFAIPTSAFASLGGTVASVETDRIHTSSALVRIQRAANYSVHELMSPAGTTIREYYGGSGIVFGVAWDGEWTPDLQQLLGSYFPQYQRATAAARRARGGSHHRVAVNDRDLVVQAGGHARSAYGVAYAPSLIPLGVSPDVVR